jgi:HEAT repeat protein
MIRALVTAAVGLVLAGDGADARRGGRLDGGIADLLSAADEAPTRERLDEVLGDAPLAELKQIAADDTLDLGIRLRATRALGLYPSIEARAALHQAMSERGDCVRDGAAVTGTPSLFMRAALEALGAMHDPLDVPRIAACLQANSRDLRVAAARALRDLGASTAVCPLQERRAVETVPQVQSAISEALRRYPPQPCGRSASTPALTAE